MKDIRVAKARKQAQQDVSGKIAQAIMGLVAKIPASKVTKQREPLAASRQRVNTAAGTLAASWTR